MITKLFQIITSKNAWDLEILRACPLPKWCSILTNPAALPEVKTSSFLVDQLKHEMLLQKLFQLLDWTCVVLDCSLAGDTPDKNLLVIQQIILIRKRWVCNKVIYKKIFSFSFSCVGGLEPPPHYNFGEYSLWKGTKSK